MRLRTVISLVVVVAVALVLAPTTASAGGAVIDFERRYYVPAEVVAGSTTFSLGGSGSGTVRDGPYFAYLVHDGFFRAPKIPADAIDVGLVRMEPTGSPRLWRATVRFRLPEEVRPGQYTIALCNRPCEHTIVGDLMGGWFTVVSSRLEARLLTAMDRLESETGAVERGLRARVFALKRQVERRAEALTELRDAAKRRDRAVAAASAAALGALEDRLEAGLATLGQAEPADSDVGGVPWSAAAYFLAGGLFVALLLVRRRPLPQVPDPPRTRDGAVHPDYTVAGKR